MWTKIEKWNRKVLQRLGRILKRNNNTFAYFWVRKSKNKCVKYIYKRTTWYVLWAKKSDFTIQHSNSRISSSSTTTTIIAAEQKTQRTRMEKETNNSWVLDGRSIALHTELYYVCTWAICFIRNLKNFNGRLNTSRLRFYSNGIQPTRTIFMRSSLPGMRFFLFLFVSVSFSRSLSARCSYIHFCESS